MVFCVVLYFMLLGEKRHKNTFSETMMDLYQEDEITELETYDLAKVLLLNSLITQEAASIAI